MKLILIIALFFQLPQIAFSQDNFSYYEVIKDDSIMLFFNDKDKFVEKECAKGIRFTRVDTDANFNGLFTDVSRDGVLLSTGFYDHGKKNGFFQSYYANGKTKSKGKFVDNVPNGVWKYFYENGQPERTLQISSEDTLLISFYNKDGNQKVIDGNGEFNGYVGNSVITQNSALANGDIVNGKPNGKWSSTIADNSYSQEEFVNGEFVKGVFLNTRKGWDPNYTNRSILNAFFPGNYYLELEKFKFQKCKDSIHFRQPKSDFNSFKFFSLMKARIADVIKTDFRENRSGNYSIGENYMTVQFTVDEKGNAQNILMATTWGDQFLRVITTSLKSAEELPPSITPLYIHMKVNIAENWSSYDYHIKITEEKFY